MPSWGLPGAKLGGNVVLAVLEVISKCKVRVRGENGASKGRIAWRRPMQTGGASFAALCNPSYHRFLRVICRKARRAAHLQLPCKPFRKIPT